MILIPVNNPFKKSRHVSPMIRYLILLDLPCTCWIILGNFDNSQKLAIKTAKILVTPISDLKISLCLVTLPPQDPQGPAPSTQQPPVLLIQGLQQGRPARRDAGAEDHIGLSHLSRARLGQGHVVLRTPLLGETSSSCLWVGWGETSSSIKEYVFTTWWFIPLSKWVITPVISGLTLLIPFITGVITHLLSGMSHHLLPIDL